MINKIISGGQTGADMGGLLAAEFLGIKTGGFCPRGYVDENGVNEELKYRFGLEPTGDLKQRTEKNIINSDCTVIFAKEINSPGTSYTIRCCQEHNKPFFVVDSLSKLKQFLGNPCNMVVNIAGNRESVHNGIRNRVRDFLVMALFPDNGVFVFGSNSDGIHGAGAALVAKNVFGAVSGLSRGIMGSSYGIVTKINVKTGEKAPLSLIQEEVNELYDFASANMDRIFFITEIGCGLTGYSVSDIAPLFHMFIENPLKNARIPYRFLKYFDGKVKKVYLDKQDDRQEEVVDKKNEIKRDVVKHEKNENNGNFVHLHVHSLYSLLDGVCELDELCARAKELGQNAIAVTDHGYMYGSYKFQKAANDAGIKAIHGVEAYFANDAMDKSQRSNYHLVLLVMNNVGWKNLCHMMTVANRDRFYYKPRIDEELLKNYNEGLICTSACYRSPVSFHLTEEGYDPDRARNNMEFLKSVFGDRFYNEVMHIGFDDYDSICPKIIELANSLNVKTVCTTDAHYVRKEDAELHEMLMNIQTDGAMMPNSRELYIKSREEMIVDYIIPEMADNTLEIADRCNFKLEFNGFNFPVFDIKKCEDYKQFIGETLR